MTTGARTLVRWKDVVVTAGGRGAEELLLAAVDLEVRAGEVVWISADDARTRAALTGILDGSRRPLYGSVTGGARAGGAPVRLLTDETPAGTDPALLGGSGEGATVVVAAAPPPSTAALPGLRLLTVTRGDLRAEEPVRRWPVVDVRDAVIGRLVDAGAADDVARRVAQVLVDADVRGHSSHGVQLLPMYLDRMRAGGIQVSARPRWLIRNGTVNVVSAAGGFGQLAAWEAAETCAAEADARGLAAVAVRDNNHVGMLAAYRQPFVDRGIVALVLNISGPGVAPPGAGRASLGNDAVCLIAPLGGGAAPLIVDFATGAVASGKIRHAALRGRAVPEGWLVGPDGRPSTDPEDLDRGGAVPVFGGTAGGYKGLGVAVITEVLAGIVAGATVSPLVNKQRQHPDKVMGCSQLFVGFSPSAFAAGNAADLVETLCAAVAGSYGDLLPPVYFPEQQEVRRTEVNLRYGLDLPGALARGLGLVE